MTTGLPRQDALIAQLEAQLDAARRASRAASDRARDRIVDAAKDEFTDAVKDYVKSTAEMKKLVDYMKRRGISQAQQEKIIEAYELASDREEVWKSYRAGRQTTEELMASQRTLLDNVTAVNKLFVDSGIADQAFDMLVERLTLTPLAPFAIAAKVARITLDVGVAEAEGIIESQDAQRVSETLDVLREQRNRIRDRVTDLRTGCLEQPRQTENQPQNQPQATSSGGGGISGGAIAGIIAAGASIPVGVWAYEEYKKTLDPDNGGTGGTTGGGGNTGGGGGGGSIATSITAANITCTRSQGGSGLYQCTGTMTVRVGPSVTAGVQLTALTLPVQVVGRATPTSTGAGQTLVFTITNSTASGCQTFTRVNFVRQPDINTAFTSWSGTIPVTCR